MIACTRNIAAMDNLALDQDSHDHEDQANTDSTNSLST